MWDWIMPPRFCRQNQAKLLAAVVELGGKLDAVIARLTVIEGKIDMADANLDSIAADLPTLLSGVNSALAEITTLSGQLAQTPPSDPRASQLDGQIQAAAQSITSALAALNPAPAPVSGGGATGATGATGPVVDPSAGPTGATGSTGATGATGP